MLFAIGDRVKGLSTLFDEGTEDAKGRVFSQREKAKGNGVWCFGNVTLAHRARGRFVSYPPLHPFFAVQLPPPTPH